MRGSREHSIVRKLLIVISICVVSMTLSGFGTRPQPLSMPRLDVAPGPLALPGQRVQVIDRFSWEAGTSCLTTESRYV
ncbi:hypothetical protein EMIT053CA3_120110 [Pseudomonas donghuensis]